VKFSEEERFRLACRVVVELSVGKIKIKKERRAGVLLPFDVLLTSSAL
jgi:hypothetical protein